MTPLVGYMKWMIPILVSFILFTNHYTRDTLGALEKQLESDMDMSPATYSHLSSIYFLPNIITPLIAGVFMEKLGGLVKCFYYAILINVIGNALFAFGIQTQTYWLLYLGKLISGSMYEIIDALLPITYTGPLFPESFPIVVGVMQLFIRLGSVINFIVSPIIYRHYGLSTVFWVAFLVSVLALPSFYFARSVELFCVKRNVIEVTNNESSGTVHASGHGDLVHLSFMPVPGRSWKDCILSFMPFDRLSNQFYFYILGGSLLYGSIVPFWFIGSKYIQESYAANVDIADSMMTIPEGLVVIIGFPLGLLVSKGNWRPSTKLIGMAVSLAGMGLGYGAFVVSASHSDKIISYEEHKPILVWPLLSVSLLGTSFAFAATLFWGLVTDLTDPCYLAQGSGLLSCAINVFPTFLPPVLYAFPASKPNHFVIEVLGFIAICGCFATLWSFLIEQRSMSKLHDDEHDGDHLCTNGDGHIPKVIESLSEDLTQRRRYMSVNSVKNAFDYEMVGINDRYGVI